MRTSLTFSLALIGVALLADRSWAQYGRPVPVRPPSVPKTVPYTGPHIVPHTVPHTGDNKSSSSDSMGWLCPVLIVAFLVICVGANWVERASERRARAQAERDTTSRVNPFGPGGFFQRRAPTPLERDATSSGRIRIIAVPPGEAPEEIRRAWVGLELPLAPGEGNESVGPAYGVLSHSPNGMREGFAVDGSTAVALLSDKDAEAARWWRTNAPDVLTRGYRLIFPPDVCDHCG